MNKDYITPTFEVVRQDESNKVFFAGSGGGPASTATVNISSMSSSSSTSW